LIPAPGHFNPSNLNNTPMKKLILLFSLVISYFSSHANDVKIIDLTYDASTRTASFTLNWKNAWTYQNGAFSDAVWLFVKFHPQNGNGTWLHADLENVAVQSSAIYRLVPDNKGTFISLSSGLNYSGDSQGILVDLILDQNIDQYLNPDIQVFAIEMVRVQEGGFYVGDGRSPGAEDCFGEADSWTSNNVSGKPLPAYFISDESAIPTIRDSPGLTTLKDPSGLPSLIDESFPKGTETFYIMKYEVSQSQFAAMANTLSATMRNEFSLGFTYGDTPLHRNGVRVDIDPLTGERTFNCDLNNNGIYNEDMDGTALPFNVKRELYIWLYLDWACLRPMTVFEYEKASRGILTPVSNEMAWGSTTKTQTVFSSDVINVGQEDEQLANPNLPGKYITGALTRCGAMATDVTNPTRTNTSATYYGAHDMSGSLWEITVWPSTAGFASGSHGDGDVDNSDQIKFGSVPYGQISRLYMGGSWENITGISTLEVLNLDFNEIGIRGVRSYPFN
jgi:formylglycine-generating enzyme required for sulfatase activity